MAPLFGDCWTIKAQQKLTHILYDFVLNKYLILQLGLQIAVKSLLCLAFYEGYVYSLGINYACSNSSKYCKLFAFTFTTVTMVTISLHNYIYLHALRVRINVLISIGFCLLRCTDCFVLHSIFWRKCSHHSLSLIMLSDLHFT